MNVIEHNGVIFELAKNLEESTCSLCINALPLSQDRVNYLKAETNKLLTALENYPAKEN